MSFIKRSDGITIYGGTHDKVRSFGGGQRADEPEFDESDIQIEAAMLTLGEAACVDVEDPYIEDLSNELAGELWEVYDGECAHINRGSFGQLFWSVEKGK